VNLAVLLIAFQVQVRGFFTRDFFWALARIALAAVLMGGAVWFLSRRLEAMEVAHLLGSTIKVLVPVGAGVIVYFGAARLLRLAEAESLLRRFSDRRELQGEAEKQRSENE
jgi:hypothetical protein